MGDLPKPTDDASWTEVERTFFAAAPPEESHRVGETPSPSDPAAPPAPPPRRPRIARLQTWVAGAGGGAALVLGAAGRIARTAWRRCVLVIGGASVRARKTVRACAAGLVAALAIFCVDRRRVVLALVGAVMVARLSAGGVAFRKNGSTKPATAQREDAGDHPTIAEAVPGVNSPSEAALQPDARSSTDLQQPSAEVPNRRHPLIGELCRPPRIRGARR